MHRMRAAPSLVAAAVAVLAAVSSAEADELNDGMLSVGTVVAYALEHSPNGHILRNGLAAAHLDTAAARSVFEPRLYSSFNSSDRTGTELGTTFEAGVEKLLESGSRLGVGYLNSRYGHDTLSELKLSYTLPLFGGQNQDTLRALNEAALNESAYTRRLRAGLEDLILDTIAGYYDLVLANGSEQVARNGAEAARSLYRVAKLQSALSEGGPMTSRYAELQVERARHAVGIARHRRESAEARLRMLAGYPRDAILTVPDAVPDVEQGKPESLDHLIELAEDGRTELVNLRAEIAQLERRQRQQARRTIPVEVSLQAAFTGDGSGIDDNLDMTSPQFGIGFDMSLGSRRERDLERQRLDIQLNARRYALANLQYAVQAEVQEAYYSRAEKRDQLLFASKRTVLARDELTQAELRLKSGMADVRDALDKQQELVQAKHEALDSRVQYIIAGYRLDRSTGRLPEQWSRYLDH